MNGEMFSSLSPELNAGYVITSCHKWDYYKITIKLSPLSVCFLVQQMHVAITALT